MEFKFDTHILWKRNYDSIYRYIEIIAKQILGMPKYMLSTDEIYQLF